MKQFHKNLSTQQSRRRVAFHKLNEKPSTLEEYQKEKESSKDEKKQILF